MERHGPLSAIDGWRQKHENNEKIGEIFNEAILSHWKVLLNFDVSAHTGYYSTRYSDKSHCYRALLLLVKDS